VKADEIVTVTFLASVCAKVSEATITRAATHPRARWCVRWGGWYALL